MTVFVGQTHNTCVAACVAMAVGSDLQGIIDQSTLQPDGTMSNAESVRLLTVYGKQVGFSGWDHHVNSTPSGSVSLPLHILAAIKAAGKETGISTELFVRFAVERACRAEGIDILMPDTGEEPVVDPITRKEDELTCIMSAVPLADTAALVMVKVKADPDNILRHCLFWDGGELWDPSLTQDENPVSFAAYKIESITPIKNISSL